MDKPRILIVDDEETIRHILLNVIAWNDCEAREAASAEEGLAMLSDFSPDVALLDIVLPGRNGLELLKEIKQRSPDTEVVMMTSHSSAETALRAIREGAYGYLQKPFENLDEIWTTLQRALEKRNLARKKHSLLQKHDERSERLSSDINLADGGTADDEASSSAELLDFFMDMVTDELGVSDACILLLDDKAAELRTACRRTGGTRDPANARIRIGEGICGGVAKTGIPFVLSSSQPAQGDGLEAGPLPVDALFPGPIALCAPIKSDRKVLGVFAAGARINGERFNEGDSAHLTSLGGQLAVAVEAARRASRLEKAYESLKAAQTQLVRSERLKAIGQMAAGVAHDFNNVLSVILGRAEFAHASLQGEAFDRGKAISDLATIIKAARQGGQAIKRIQDYTRIRKDQPRAPLDLNAAVRDAIEIAKPKWKQETESRGLRINVHLELAEVPRVTGNLLELTQVVENLLFNAVEAMPNGGRISFKTYQEEGSVVLEVSDEGTGMDEETRKRLFEPFFTTKESGQGLGTSIIFGIITRHKGTISVRSKPGSGTTFRISLPPHVGASEEIARSSPAVATQPIKARILVVDDEPFVRSVCEEALKSFGHEVVAVASGQAAITHLEKIRFDLVITDLSMGGMSGYQVANNVKRIDSSVPVILLSGWALEQNSPEVRRAGIDLVIVKPCGMAELRDAVQAVLAKGAGELTRASEG
jgi:signal transduction histidine kinase/CheY-like chemotaxis protein